MLNSRTKSNWRIKVQLREPRPGSLLHHPRCQSRSRSAALVPASRLRCDGLTGWRGCRHHSHQNRGPDLYVSMSDLCIRVDKNETDLNVCPVISLHGRNAPSLVELDLPDAAEIRQEIPRAFTRFGVPHFERAVRARHNLLPVVHEAGDCA